MCIRNKRQSHTKKSTFYNELSGCFEGSFHKFLFERYADPKDASIDMNEGQ